MHTTMRLVFLFTGIAIIIVLQGTPASGQPTAITTVPCFPNTSGSSSSAGGGVTVIPGVPPAMMVNPNSQEEKKWNSKALEGCAKLSSIITPRNSKLLGFEKAQDILHVQISKPIDIFSIGLVKLRVYQPGDPVMPLVTQLNSRLYLLSVGGKVKSSLLISRQKGTDTLIPTGWGMTKLATLVAKYKTADSQIVLWVPNFLCHFIGEIHDDGRIMLTPLATRKLYGLREGVPIDAGVVFALLAQHARAQDETQPG